MATQVWFRNPKFYIREIVELRVPNVVWDRGFLVKNAMDPMRFCELYYPPDVHFRMLIVGDEDQNTVGVSRGGSLDKPEAVYPTWFYGDDLGILEEMLENPVGEDAEACSNEKVPREFRPVFGQEHRVVITDIPSVGTGPGRKIVRILHELQMEYPEAIVHIHGLYSYRTMFGFSFRSVDVDSRARAAKGDVELANGKYMRFERAAEFPQWVSMLGFKPVDLSVPRNRCLFNIKSALWSAKHFKENKPFRSTALPDEDVNTTAADSAVAMPDVKSFSLRSPAKDTDKILCDTCSLQKECKYYRAGAVCSVPGAESSKLSQYFNTRDSDTIITGLGALLGKQADRLERGLDDEQYGDELDPEVSKLINSLFTNGVKLAKLTNPDLNGGPKVGVFVNGGQGAQVAVGASASQLTAAIVRELEAKGIPREDITPEMIGQVLDSSGKGNPAIEAHATVEHSDG